MTMRINPYGGISRMRRYRIMDMCKGKRKLWLRGTNDVLVVELHMVGKRVKVSSLNNVSSFLSLYFSFTWFIPLISLLPLLFSLFLNHSLSFSHTHTHIYFSLLFYFSFFLFHTHIFLLTFPSLDIFIFLFKALNSSLSCINTIWNLK
jgi:hypothetical protein